jgi:hypothetical protein
LAYGLAKVSGWPECELLSGNRIASVARRTAQFIRSAHFGLEKGSSGTYPMCWTDISRVHALPFLQPPYRKPEKSSMWFGIHGFGKVLMPNAHGRLAFIVDSNVAKKNLGEKWQRLLKMAASSIISIGSREGLVVVKNVEMEDARIESRRASTSYYLPLESVTYSDPPLKDLELAEFWSFGMDSLHWFNTKARYLTSEDEASISAKPFILPLLKKSREPTQVDVRLSHQGMAFTTDERDPWRTVVGNKSWYQ